MFTVEGLYGKRIVFCTMDWCVRRGLTRFCRLTLADCRGAEHVPDEHWTASFGARVPQSKTFSDCWLATSHFWKSGLPETWNCWDPLTACALCSRTLWSFSWDRCAITSAQRNHRVGCVSMAIRTVWTLAKWFSPFELRHCVFILFYISLTNANLNGINYIPFKIHALNWFCF